MAINLEQVIRLMEKTGEKFIFNQGNENYVLLSVDDYEKMLNIQSAVRPVVDLTEDELVSKISDEIAQWRATQAQEVDVENFFVENKAENSDLDEVDEQYYLEPID